MTDGVVKVLNVEHAGQFEISSTEKMLTRLR
jgi:peroxiredoxin